MYVCSHQERQRLAVTVLLYFFLDGCGYFVTVCALVRVFPPFGSGKSIPTIWFMPILIDLVDKLVDTRAYCSFVVISFVVIGALV